MSPDNRLEDGERRNDDRKSAKQVHGIQNPFAPSGSGNQTAVAEPKIDIPRGAQGRCQRKLTAKVTPVRQPETRHTKEIGCRKRGYQHIDPATQCGNVTSNTKPR